VTDGHGFSAVFAFMLRERGMPAMRNFFRASTRDDSLALIQTRFSAAFGWTLTEAEGRWRTALVAAAP